MERTLPHNNDAERATLGSIFLDREAIVPIAAWLEPEHFYNQKHAWIYTAQQQCYTERTPPDLTTVADVLRRQDRLEKIGGVPYLIELSNSVTTAYHVEYYAKIVKRTALLRLLFQAGGKISALALDEEPEVEAVFATAEKTLFQVTQAQQERDYEPMSRIADTFYSKFEREVTTGSSGLFSIPTGLLDLDRLLGGLFATDLIILAARPGVGKTSLATGILDHACTKGYIGGFFSIEMARDQLITRMISSDTGIDASRFRRSPQFRDDELVAISNSVGCIHSLPMFIDDTPGISLQELRSKARRMVAQDGVQFIVVDYLTKIETGDGGKQENRVQAVGRIARSLKDMARELNIPVLALAQLNRGVEGRQDARPQLADLRESGEIEQEADEVAFIYRDEMYNKKSPAKGTAEIILAKHRHGPTGTVNVGFNAATTKFFNLAQVSSPEGY